jgi:hypothetical protein
MWFSHPTYPPPEFYGAAANKIKTFICPAAPTQAPENNANGSTGLAGGHLIGLHMWNTDTAFITGSTWFDDWNGSEQYWNAENITHYAPSAGCGIGSNPTTGKFAGIFANRSAMSLPAISDGTSNTILYAESAGRVWSGDLTRPNRFVRGWMGAGSVFSYFGTKAGREANVYGMGSYHSGIVLAGMGDGSVRGIRIGVPANTADSSWLVLQTMAGANDGLVADTASISN